MPAIHLRLLASTALLILATPLTAQAVESGPVAEDAPVDFSAEQLVYDDATNTVTASGDVRMAREGNRVRADRISWDRTSGRVFADGSVVLVNPGGDKAYGDHVELTDTLKDGVVDNLLLVLADGGRLAADRATRMNGVSTLENAAYTPCPVVDNDGCPRNPSWQIEALRIVHDPAGRKIRFRNARLRLFGVPLFVIPSLTIPRGDGGSTGLLTPDLRYSRTNGLEFALPVYFRLSSNRDLTVTPHVYTDVLPALALQYRALTENGAYQIGGMATYSSRLPISGGGTRQRDFRGYLDASGRFQLDPAWSVSGSIRRVTDRTFLRRYDISNDDRLRSVVRVERQGAASYLSINNWAFQTLRTADPQSTLPVVLPEADYRLRLPNAVAGGQVSLQLNGLALARDDGQDTQRLFAAARWDLRRVTTLGQELLLTAYGRGDVYHSRANARTPTALYRGEPGTQARAIAAVAAEVRWPLIGPAFGGTQRITPRVQLVASPEARNLRVPNEDSRAVDLEDINLFSLSRYPGYDRWEDGVRLTYGLDYAFDGPGWSVEATVGQSHRFAGGSNLFPDGTGLNDQTSDIVGRTSVKFRRLVEFTHRYRLDKDSFALRRNEIDATIGGRNTYALVGYLKLNRDIGPLLEDLRDREELRLAGRVALTKYISVFGSTIVDLTNKGEDPLSLSDGYEPVRHRLGIAYTDDCLDIGLTWRREYQTTGDARSGNSFALRLAFRGLGR